MDEKILKLTVELKEELLNDQRIIELIKAEKAMEDDIEAEKLSYQKDLAASEYSDMIKIFGRESDEALRAQKKLYEVKKKLDSLPVVRNYLEKYKEVRNLYSDINKVLFDEFVFDICKGHRK
ncbi:MAG: YlbF family regulator [Erysipelotrichaceae bacterium]|nr:YlbF family regulator [Erysipelotrichaceae bacterium]